MATSPFLYSIIPLQWTNVENKDYGDKDKENRYYSNSQLSEVFLNRNRPSYIGDFIIMTDRHLYHRWGKLRESLKTNKPVEAVAEDEISAGTMFDKAKSNQLIEPMQMFTHAMYGISVGPAMALAKVFDFSSLQQIDGYRWRFRCLRNRSGKTESKHFCYSLGITASLHYSRSIYKAI